MQEQPHATRHPAYRENLLRLNVRFVNFADIGDVRPGRRWDVRCRRQSGI